MLKRDVRYQAAILQDHRVMLIRIIERDGTTFWLPPGGGREAGETEEVCVAREALEETGLQVTVERLLFVDPAIPGTEYSQSLRTYLCLPHGGIAAPGTEPEVDSESFTTIQELGWFDLRDRAGWPPEAVMGKITRGWLNKLQLALGYTPITEMGRGN